MTAPLRGYTETLSLVAIWVPSSATTGASRSPQQTWEGKTRHKGRRVHTALCHTPALQPTTRARPLGCRLGQVSPQPPGPLLTPQQPPVAQETPRGPQLGCKAGRERTPKRARPRRFTPRRVPPASAPRRSCSGPPAPISPASLSGPLAPAGSLTRPATQNGSSETVSSAEHAVPSAVHLPPQARPRPPARRSRRPRPGPVTQRAVPPQGGRQDYSSQEAAGRAVTPSALHQSRGGRGWSLPGAPTVAVPEGGVLFLRFHLNSGKKAASGPLCCEVQQNNK